MERHFDEELAGVKHLLLRMGALTEAMLGDAMRALVRNDRNLLDPIFTQEAQVNRLQIDVDEMCLRLIALHQPTASDLRFLLAVSKINTELERLGDEAVNIAETVTKLLAEPPLKPFDLIPQMVEIANGMVKDSLHAFVSLDAERARRVLVRDDKVDTLRDQVIAELLSYMRNDPAAIGRGMDLIIIAKKLERIADHATNIAEDVIFVAEGKDVRHHAGEKLNPPAAS